MCQQIARTFLSGLYTVSTLALEGKVLAVLPKSYRYRIPYTEEEPRAQASAQILSLTVVWDISLCKLDRV